LQCKALLWKTISLFLKPGAFMFESLMWSFSTRWAVLNLCYLCESSERLRRFGLAFSLDPFIRAKECLVEGVTLLKWLLPKFEWNNTYDSSRFAKDAVLHPTLRVSVPLSQGSLYTVISFQKLITVKTISHSFHLRFCLKKRNGYTMFQRAILFRWCILVILYFSSKIFTPHYNSQNLMYSDVFFL